VESASSTQISYAAAHKASAKSTATVLLADAPFPKMSMHLPSKGRDDFISTLRETFFPVYSLTRTNTLF